MESKVNPIPSKTNGAAWVLVFDRNGAFGFTNSSRILELLRPDTVSYLLIGVLVCLPVLPRFYRKLKAFEKIAWKGRYQRSLDWLGWPWW